MQRVHPDIPFRCVALCCTLRPAVCVARQLLAARELEGDLRPRSSRRKRGLAVTFPTCRSDVCAQGCAIREALGDECAASVRIGGRDDLAEQVGRLVEWVRLPTPPTIDSRLGNTE